MFEPKREFMQIAIEQARAGRTDDNYAIGAVIVRDGKVIASSHNRTRTDKDPTQHAEVAAIRQAARVLGHRHLTGCVMYATHEPCPMCATAAVWARLACVIIGAQNEDMDTYRASDKSERSWRTIAIPAREIFEKGTLRVEIVEGFMREECKALFH